ncbi:MAG: DUF4364 family protein [Lachnospiraceae bacterium]|nr:DUF4364 family protein [Lachnospiraceae bacterium]
MSGDANTLYKLIILYFLSKVDYPLTNAEISGFLLEREYTNYFTIQEVISDLLDSELISSTQIRNSSYFQLTPAGKETLSYFDNEISDSIKSEIDQFLRENSYKLRSEYQSPAEYYETKKGEYTVRLRIIEGESTLLDLSYVVPSESKAIEICDGWSKNNEKIYTTLFDLLVRNV